MKMQNYGFIAYSIASGKGHNLCCSNTHLNVLLAKVFLRKNCGHCNILLMINNNHAAKSPQFCRLSCIFFFVYKTADFCTTWPNHCLVNFKPTLSSLAWFRLISFIVLLYDSLFLHRSLLIPLLYVYGSSFINMSLSNICCISFAASGISPKIPASVLHTARKKYKYSQSKHERGVRVTGHKTEFKYFRL